MITLTTQLKKLKTQYQRFRKDQQGLASVEFAFVAPLLIATYFGCVEVSRAYITKNKVETISETVADLVAQGTAIDKAQLTDIFSISSKMLTTSEEAKFNIAVTAIRTLPAPGGGSTTTVQWSESKTGENTRTVGDNYTELPDGIAQNFETIIVTELFYQHKAMFEFFIKGEKSFDRRFITKPRYSSDIPCTDC